MDFVKAPFSGSRSFIVAGGIQNKLVSWQRVLEDHPERELIIRWIRDGIAVEEFGKRFCGTFQGVCCDWDLPVLRVFRNHGSCKKLSRFIGNTILQRLSTGSCGVESILTNHPL